MESGIRNILIISNPEYIDLYKYILGDGSKLGITIRYKKQYNPVGLPDAFILGEKFINREPICLNLGDHILYGKK